jgi:hypothetical protein
MDRLGVTEAAAVAPVALEEAMRERWRPSMVTVHAGIEHPASPSRPPNPRSAA